MQHFLLKVASVICTLELADAVGFAIPKALTVLNSSTYEVRDDATEAALKAGSFILWTGSFLFISLVGGIWVWLGSNMRKNVKFSKFPVSLHAKVDEDQRGAKSPLRSLASTRTQRPATTSKPPIQACAEV